MPRKKKPKQEIPVTEPTPLSEPLEQIMAAREAKARIEPDSPMPEPEQAEPQASHVERVQARKMQPVPDGFRSISTFSAAGLRVNQSLDKKTVAIQFDEAYRAIRGGPNSEVELLDMQGFRYKEERRQWERTDFESPGVNAVTAQRFGKELADRRTGQGLTV